MGNSDLIDFDQCDELNEVMRRRPALLAHGTVLVLGVLVCAGLAWLITSRANLVVIAHGRVRPLDETHPVFTSEKFAASTGGRVVKVHYTQGQQVEQGDTLVCFDTTWLDREITSRKRAIATSVAELDRLSRLERNMAAEFEAKLNEAQALVTQARTRLTESRQRRERQIDLAKVELRKTAQRLERLERLLQRKVISDEELRNAQADADLAVSRLRIAELPVDASQINVLEQQTRLVEREYRVQRDKFAVQRDTKTGEVERAQIDLATLLLERKQAQMTAPVAGVVITAEPKIGDVIPAGQIVAEIARQGALRLDVAIPAEDVGHIRIGMPVRVKLDAYDYQEYGTVDGRVTFVSPDSQVTELTDDLSGGLPVFLARVRLERDTVGRGRPLGRVRIGMAGIAEVHTEQRSLFSLLAQRIDRAVRID